MEAMMIKPPDFDPTKKYPVMSFTYGGPHAPQVRNAWGGPTYLFHQSLAQKGYIIWVLDNRTASGKGEESAWPVYKNFGELELRDLEDGVAWLKSQPYVDGIAHRYLGLELRRIHDQLRADPQQELQDWHRGRYGRGLARLRHDLYRALHGDAAKQSRRLSEEFTGACGQRP